MSGRTSAVLDWYRRSYRRLPWRAPPGVPGGPYKVWLSEIMLQQTTVAAVIPYFARFLERWPGVADLAAAERDEVLTAWAGLGYYARARNLHACARAVAGSDTGRFPDTEAGLLALPGIGAYTAAAIAAIAFERPATVVDGNVERVVSRLFAVEDPLPQAKPRLRALAATLTPQRHPGDYAQAMMDLGATLCTPRSPKCVLCPLRASCAAAAVAGLAETLPRRAAKPERPTRRGVAFWLVDGEGAVLLRRRAERGLLGGMVEVPSTVWSDETPSAAALTAQAPLPVSWRILPGLVRHTFTHFHLELTVVAGRIAGPGPSSQTDGFWVSPARLDGQALPSVMRKLIRHALEAS